MTASTTPSDAPARPWRSIPIDGIGDTLRALPRIKRDMLGVVSERCQRNGLVVRQNQGPIRAVNLFGPDANRFVLLDRDEIFSAKKSWDLIMGRIFTNGLLLRDGEDHRFHRRLLREAFRTPALQSYLDQMNEALVPWAEGLALKGGHIRAFPVIKQMALDMACRIFLGLPPGSDNTKMNHAFEATVAASMSILRLPIPGLEFNRGLEGRKYMIRRFKRMIQERRGGESGGSDTFTRLCHAENENGERLADQEIIDHMIFLMMAAHDTTTSALTSLLYELAANSAWQERLRDEVHAFDKPAIEWDDLLHMKDHILAIQEVLRRYPPLSTIPRMATADFEWGGYRIPAGTMTIIYPIHTHHMAKWWSDPFRFDPDRFAEGREEHKRHSHSYAPFGGGNHMCLGLRFAETQIKAALFQLLQRVRLSVPEGYVMPVQQAPISKPVDGLPLTLEPL